MGRDYIRGDSRGYVVFEGVRAPLATFVSCAIRKFHNIAISGLQLWEIPDFVQAYNIEMKSFEVRKLNHIGK